MGTCYIYAAQLLTLAKLVGKRCKDIAVTLNYIEAARWCILSHFYGLNWIDYSLSVPELIGFPEGAGSAVFCVSPATAWSPAWFVVLEELSICYRVSL